MLRPSRVVEQMRGIPFFVGKSSSNCSVCGRPLTAHESVARGIGPVCVRKHMGPGAHPSGSPQSAHAGGRGKRKLLSELAKTMPKSTIPVGTGIEGAKVNTYGDGTRVLWKINTYGAAESELMVYEFSESIGWGIVPETIMPKGTKDVSVQRWVEGETINTLADRAWEEGEDAEFDELVGLKRKNSRMLTMDTLLGNPDRHPGNILVDGEGKQWAIDNNLAFGAYRRRHRDQPKGYDYGRIPRYGKRVAKGWQGRIDAAKDVARWSKTPAYRKYVAKLEQTHGKFVVHQFGLNVADLADWSRKAKVME